MKKVLVIAIIIIMVLYGSLFIFSEKISYWKGNNCNYYESINETNYYNLCLQQLHDSWTYHFANFNVDILFRIAGMEY
jgi:uncharacterized protein YxeA